MFSAIRTVLGSKYSSSPIELQKLKRKYLDGIHIFTCSIKRKTVVCSVTESVLTWFDKTLHSLSFTRHSHAVLVYSVTHTNTGHIGVKVLFMSWQKALRHMKWVTNHLVSDCQVISLLPHHWKFWFSGMISRFSGWKGRKEAIIVVLQWSDDLVLVWSCGNIQN